MFGFFGSSNDEKNKKAREEQRDRTLRELEANRGLAERYVREYKPGEYSVKALADARSYPKEELLRYLALLSFGCTAVVGQEQMVLLGSPNDLGTALDFVIDTSVKIKEMLAHPEIHAEPRADVEKV